MIPSSIPKKMIIIIIFFFNLIIRQRKYFKPKKFPILKEKRLNYSTSAAFRVTDADALNAVQGRYPILWSKTRKLADVTVCDQDTISRMFGRQFEWERGGGKKK